MASDPPRLTYLVSSLGIGGAEVGMARLLRGLPPDAFDVTVVALDAGDGQTVADELPDHVEVVDLGIANKLSVHRLWPLVSIAARTDVLVGSVYHAEIVARLAGTLLGVETVLTWAHNERFQTPLRRRIDRRTVGLCDGVLADSEAVAGMVRTRQGAPDEDVFVVPIAGIDPDEFDVPSRPLARAASGVEAGTPLDRVPADATVVGTVGSLIGPKNHDAVLAVADRLADRDVHFAIAGDGPRRSALADAVRDRHLTNVSLLGHVDSVPRFLSATDLYFQPSVHEGLCITVVEAMAAGKPIVASEVGGIAHTVRHGREGFLAAADDLGAFERYLRRLATAAPLRASMGRNARERVMDRYSRRALVEGFLAAVDRTHGARSGSGPPP